MTRIYALVAVALFVLVMFFYFRESGYIYNTLEIKRLIVVSLALGAALAGGIIWKWRDRFQPWNRHLPEVISIAVTILFFSPLLGSVVNRLTGTTKWETFAFEGEQARYAQVYGILISIEDRHPSYWLLQARQNGKTYQFKYRNQPYFPITKRGETIELPVSKGLLGVRVMQLR